MITVTPARTTTKPRITKGSPCSGVEFDSGVVRSGVDFGSGVVSLEGQLAGAVDLARLLVLHEDDRAQRSGRPGAVDRHLHRLEVDRAAPGDAPDAGEAADDARVLQALAGVLAGGDLGRQAVLGDREQQVGGEGGAGRRLDVDPYAALRRGFIVGGERDGDARVRARGRRGQRLDGPVAVGADELDASVDDGLRRVDAVGLPGVGIAVLPLGEAPAENRSFQPRRSQ